MVNGVEQKEFCVQWTSWLADLKCQECSGWYKKITRKAPTDFEILMNLVGPNIVKRGTRFRAAIPIQERLGVTLGFGPQATRTPVCNIFSKFLNNQADCTRSVSSYC
jgi:hypothetical protein